MVVSNSCDDACALLFTFARENDKPPCSNTKQIWRSICRGSANVHLSKYVDLFRYHPWRAFALCNVCFAEIQTSVAAVIYARMQALYFIHRRRHEKANESTSLASEHLSLNRTRHRRFSLCKICSARYSISTLAFLSQKCLASA